MQNETMVYSMNPFTTLPLAVASSLSLGYYVARKSTDNEGMVKRYLYISLLGGIIIIAADVVVASFTLCPVGCPLRCTLGGKSVQRCSSTVSITNISYNCTCG